MPRAWRIVKARYVATALDGEGARRYGGRWNSPGTPVVYASETRALCLLEVLAGLRSVGPLQAYMIVPASFDASLIREVGPEELPPEWRQHPPSAGTQRIGDAWVREKGSAILRVPSAIVPEEFNYVFDPYHPDFRRIEVGAPEEVVIDPRLLT